MKKVTLFAVAVGVLSACEMTGTAPAGEMRLATVEDFAPLFGRPLALDGDPAKAVTINPGGTLSGSWDGKPVLGTYEIRDGYWCRTLSAGPSGPSPEDCQVFVKNGDTLNITRGKGTGKSFVYKVL